MTDSTGDAFSHLVDVLARLRGPGGCPWDREQTHDSLKRSLLEESYEVLEAIDNKVPARLAEELGDVLFQVLFHAQIAAGVGDFTVDDVVETLREFNDVHSNRPISEEELESAKAGILQSYPASFERPSQVVNQLLQLTLFDLPNDYFQTVKSCIEGVSLGDVHRIGRELVEPDGLSILVVGDREAIEPGLRELELPVVLLTDDGAEIV